MSAQILYIQTKNRIPDNTVAKLGDFDYQEGEFIDTLNVIKAPNITLYCLDLKSQRAIFVETPIGVNISRQPFYYLAQYEHAQKLIALPLEELCQWGKKTDKIGNLIVIYSVGRCGSTLLSKVFDQLDTVLSLSEPDVFSQIVGLREPDGSNDEKIVGLLKACINILAKQAGQENTSYCAIKLRSFGIEIGDLIHQAYPKAKAIFLYRNVDEVVKSSIRSFAFLGKLLPAMQANISFYSRFIPLLTEYEDDIDFSDSRAIDFYVTAWLSVMQRYLMLQKQGIINCAIRYKDLVEQPYEMVALLFQECGLPIAQVKHACKVFGKDSQSGSNLSRANTYKGESEEIDNLEIFDKIKKVLKLHPVIHTPEFIVPDTLGHES